jgi:hypothetical protein
MLIAPFACSAWLARRWQSRTMLISAAATLGAGILLFLLAVFAFLSGDWN